VELTFLGSGNAFAAGGRYWSSFIADRRVQFDAPPTLLAHLKKLGVSLPDLDVVFLSHHHADHFVGLPFLLLEYVYVTERTRDLYIVGPPGVEEWMEDFACRCYPEVTRKETGYQRRYIDAEPGKEQTANGVKFTAYPMNHVTKTMRAMGYRVQMNGGTVAYTGDTMYCDEIYDLADGADVLVVDCTYVEGSGPEHMGMDDIRIIRDRLPQSTAMILTHLNGCPKVDGMKNVYVAEDLKSFNFP